MSQPLERRLQRLSVQASYTDSDLAGGNLNFSQVCLYLETSNVFVQRVLVSKSLSKYHVSVGALTVHTGQNKRDSFS